MNIQEINKFLEPLRRQPIDMRDMNLLLQLIKQHDYKFDKDEILEISNLVSGRMNELFVTPNKVAELISVIAEIYNPKSVIDICCGVGNILRYFKSLEIIKGLDINKSRIQWAEYINPDANFLVADALEYNFGNDKYDLVVGEPPFNARMSDRRLLDIELIKKGLALLNNDGVAIFIVAEGLLTNSASFEFRQEILSNFVLDMVISLPIGAFLPYTSIKTSILVIRKGEKNQDVFMPEFKDNSHEIADNFKHHKGDFYLRLSKITDRLDRNYYASIETIEEIIRDHKLIKLSDVAEIISGKYLDRNSITSNGNYLIFSRKDKSFINVVPDERCVLKRDDIVVSLWNTKPDNEVFIYEDDIKMVIPQLYAIIRPSAKYKEYLKTYLQTQDWKIIVQRYVMGSVQPRLSIQDLRQIEIPLLSEDELNELVSKTLRINNENRYYIQESFKSLESEKYEEAKDNIEKAFENADSETMLHKEVYLQNIDRAEKLEEKNKELEEKNKQLLEKEKELEDMMSMFAHKFRSPLDAIIYNTSHDKDPKLYIEAAQTMRGLLDVFSIISTDDKILKEKIKADNQGNARLITVLSKTLDMILLHLLSVAGTEKIQQHYLRYAKAQGKVADSVTPKEWYNDYFELERDLQSEWEQSFSQLLRQSASLEQRLNWIEQHFFKLDIIGFERDDIQFKEYATTESFLTILLNETLVNVFKYYSCETQQAVILEWSERDGNQILSCRNPSTRGIKSKGSGKGHVFLSALARKIGTQFVKPKLQDDFVLEFSIPNELLLSNATGEK